ncbi:Substance-K receptor [Trichoplax sp. H2]|nr:Substance-K receptor [Trichoplax sp. H2]|eukprot:RDD37921.1 Substance-K receptor [Trichoplax sp. H2]
MGVSAATMQLVAFIPSAIILVLGLINNIVILVTIIKNRSKNTKALVYSFIANLILYDIFVLTLYWPIQLIKMFIFWPFGSFWCYICNSFPILFNAGFGVTMVFIAISNYCVILREPNPNPSTSRKLFLSTTIFLIAIGLSSPSIIFTKYLSSSYGKSLCYISPPSSSNDLTIPKSWLIYYSTIYAAVYAFPTAIIIGLYSRVLYKLSQQSRDINDTANQLHVRQQKEMIRLFLILGVIFLLLSTPEFIYYWIYYSHHSNNFISNSEKLIQLILQLISISKSVINSWIYACFVPEGKQILSHIYCVSLRKRKVHK